MPRIMNGDVSPDGDLNGIREGFQITFALHNPEGGNQVPPRQRNHGEIIKIGWLVEKPRFDLHVRVRGK